MGLLALSLIAVGVFGAGFVVAWPVAIRTRRCVACVERAEIDRITSGWGTRAPLSLASAPAHPTTPLEVLTGPSVIRFMDQQIDHILATDAVPSMLSGTPQQPINPPAPVPGETSRPRRYRGRRRRTWVQTLAGWWEQTRPADDPVVAALAWAEPREVRSAVVWPPRARFRAAPAETSALLTLAADWRAALLAVPVEREVFTGVLLEAVAA